MQRIFYLCWIYYLIGVFNIKEERTKAARDIKINKNKSEILKHIVKNPGVRYRELLRLTGLANGVLSYHLKILEESKLLATAKTPNDTGTGEHFKPADMLPKPSAANKLRPQKKRG